MAKVEKVTAEDIERAEQALEDGRRALEEAREAFFDGRGEWSSVKDQEAVVEYAEASIVKLSRDKAKYDEEVRHGELVKLRNEIDKSVLASGDEFSKLLNDFESAAAALAGAFEVRNQKLTEWVKRMKDLGVPPLGPTKLVPAASEAGLGWRDAYGDVDLQAGGRQFRFLYSGRYLTGVLHGLGVEHSKPQYFFDEGGIGPDIETLRKTVAEIDHELPGIPEDALFWRTLDGGLLTTSPDHAFSPEIIKRDGLVQISREEALNG